MMRFTQEEVPRVEVKGRGGVGVVSEGREETTSDTYPRNWMQNDEVDCADGETPTCM